MKKCIIFDIDGTVADLGHRVHHVQGKRKDWAAFMAALSKDAPIEQTIYLHSLIDEGFDGPVYFASGRSEDERADTEAWLSKHDLNYDYLYMRKSKDYRADHIVKREILHEIRANGFEPWLIFDDRQQVVDMWREEGCFVLQCDPFKNFTAHADYNFHEGVEYPLTLMVGPSGAGKSTWIDMQPDIHDSHVVSSDQIRADLCGDFKIQDRNQEVFETLHELVSLRLKRGLPVVVDATNIRNADRKAIVDLAPSDMPVRYVVINRPVVAKKATGGWRNSVSIKGTTLIDKHDQTFKSNLKEILSGDGYDNVTVESLL